MVAQSTTVTLGCQVKFGLAPWLSGKEAVPQCRGCGLDPWVRKIPQGRKWQPTRVFVPEKTPWTEESGGLWSVGLQRVRNDSVTTHTRNLTKIILSKLGTFSFLSSNKGNPKGASYWISGSRTHSLRFLIFLSCSNV